MADETRNIVMMPLVGENHSHKEFRASIATVKSLAFVVAKREGAVDDFVKESCSRFAKHSDPRMVIAMRGGASRFTGKCGVLSITKVELDLAEIVVGGRQHQMCALMFREVYRAFETYLVDLFVEIADADSRVLHTHKNITHKDALESGSIQELKGKIIEKRKQELTRIGFSGLEDEYGKIGVPIVTEEYASGDCFEDNLRFRLKWMAELRNVLEHEKGVITPSLVRLHKPLESQLGQRLQLNLTDLGEAINTVEFVADFLNVRAVEKFNILDGMQGKPMVEVTGQDVLHSNGKTLEKRPFRAEKTLTDPADLWVIDDL